ncbi:hypothetical protein HDE_03879 [Halotydeus destructor]|nr:hypothetical protein HDE_03879 [Halotydeus destructor]
MMNSLRLLRSIPLRHQLVSYRNVSRAVVCLQGRNSDAWKTERQPSEFKKVHNNPAGVGSKAYEGQQVKSEIKSEDPEEEMNRKDPSKKDGYMAGQGFEDHQSPVQRGDKGTSYRPSEYDEVAERATKEFEAKNYSEDQLHSAQHLQHGAYRKDPLTNMADKAKDMKDKVKEKMHDAKDNIADKMHDAGDKMADKAHEAN